MTDIDPRADLEVRFAGEHVTVKVPLAAPVTGEWLQDYQKLALAAEVRAQVGTCDDRAWIIVTMPASSDQGKVAATLDAARVLIADADAAERPPATAEAERRPVSAIGGLAGEKALCAGPHLGSRPRGYGPRNAGRWPAR